MLAAQLSDDQIAVIGSVVVFAGCIVMMMLSQKIGDSVRGQTHTRRERVVPFPGRRATDQQTTDRHAA